MSAWADLAGDDSNLSMAADEFVGLSVLGDISNSVSHNRSRFDPELDNSKQGLNRQLKLFGLGNDSNSNLSKKRQHSDLQTEEDDVDMPPKSKQRTSGPGQNDFSRFLEPGATSAPDLSSLSSSSTNASGTTGSLGSISTPTEDHKPRTWYSAILGKNKGRSSKKGTPQSVSSSHVPALVSTTSTTANPTPKSTSKTVKLGGSIPSSVRRRRMLRKRKSKSSPHKRVESTTSAQEEQVTDIVVEENISPEKEQQHQYQPMDQDGGGDTREAFENGLKVLKTQSQGRIYVPLDILQSTEKQADQPKPTPFRLMRSKSAGKCGSMSPTKLSFTEESSPPASGVSDSCASSPPVVPFNLFNFMPLPIPAASFGLTTSTSVSNSETPNNEADGQEEFASVVQPQSVPTTLPFVPFVPPVLPMNGLGFPSTNADESKANEESSVPSNPMLFNFVTMPLPLSTPISNGSSTAPLQSPPTFVPFVVAPPTIFQPTEPIAPVAATEMEPEPQTEAGTNAMDTDETEVVDVTDGKEEAEPVSIPSSSVWAAAPCEEDDQVPSWAKKCFKQEVARNKVLKRREDQHKVEQRKLEIQYKIREKQLLPIEHGSISGPYGSDNRDSKRRPEYHPYAENSKQSNDFKMDRRMRGRARTRSLSEGVESPLYPTKVFKRKDSTSQSGKSATSSSQGGSTSVSVEARDLPHQDPEPVTAEKIAWRLHQIEMAKNTTGYKNYMAQIPKSQRKKKHPSTPNPKEKISKRRWIGKYKLWRQQLHEFDVKESMDVDERPEEQSEQQPEATVESSVIIPTPADVELVPSAPREEEQ